MITFLHGTTTYRKDTHGPKDWAFELETHFSEGVGAKVPIFALDRLQQKLSGDLNIERLDDGGMVMRRSIVAHGAESACMQACDLAVAFVQFLGLKTNIACSHHPSW